VDLSQLPSALARLKLIAPTFTALGDPALTEWLTMARPSVGEAVFGASFVTAWAYYTAHLLATSGQVGGLQAGGPVASPISGERAGEVSRNYAQAAVNPVGVDNWLRLSAYGLHFLQLRAQQAGTKPLTSAPLQWLS
jgi:hypothetical protein